MNEAKYTKGPWKVDGCNQKDGLISIGAVDEKDGCRFRLAAVCGIDDKEDHSDESKANASLISASPDLLEALQEIEDVASFIHIEDRRDRRQLGEALDKSRTAIAKALGRAS